MAVATASYFNNAIVGTPQIGADIDVMETNLTPKYAVGFGFTRSDGNKYRYCHFGAVTNRGTVAATDVSESNVTKIENVGALVANITKRAGDNLDPNVIGSRYLQLVISATAQQFEGGYIAFTAGTGAGFTFRIRGHTTTSGNIPVTGNIYMDLYEPLTVAIDSNTDIVIAGSPYANLEAATTTDPNVAGVTVTNNSASSYGWVCTSGITAALQDATIGTYGENVMLSSTTAGAISRVSPASTTGFEHEPIIGYLVEAGSSTDYSIINVQLE